MKEQTMDETFIEKSSFKKYYFIYIGMTLLGMIVILLMNLFIETSNSISLVMVMLASMSTASFYTSDVKRKMTKAEKQKLILNTFGISTVSSIAFSASIYGAIYYTNPEAELIQQSLELPAWGWIITLLIVMILNYLMHVLGYSVGNKYKEPK